MTDTPTNDPDEHGGDVPVREIVRLCWRSRWRFAVGAVAGAVVAAAVYTLMPTARPSAVAILMPAQGAGAAEMAILQQILTQEFEVEAVAPTPRRPATTALALTLRGPTEREAAARLDAAIRTVHIRMQAVQRQGLAHQQERVIAAVDQLQRHRPRDGTTPYWSDVRQVAAEVAALAWLQSDGDRVAVVSRTTDRGTKRFSLWFVIAMGLLMGGLAGAGVGWVREVILEG